MDINKYFQTFRDVLIIMQIQMQNISKIYVIEDQPLAKFCCIFIFFPAFIQKT